MDDRSHALLRELLETPSPSGFERPIQDVVRRWVAEFAHDVRTDRHGNVIAALHPQPNRPSETRVMLAGHCDQIGLMVQHIDADGFLYVQPIGGWDMQILLGQRLTIWTENGPVAGVLSRKAPHLLTPDERNKVPQFTDVWVDIGAVDRDEAAKFVQHGDPVTAQLSYRPLLGKYASATGMDDKVGLWTVLESLRQLSEQSLAVSVYFASTVQEEIGLRGAMTSAYGIHPTIGIAVDVCHSSDTPSADRKQLGETKLGNGPVLFRGPNIHPTVLARMRTAAESESIAVQVRGVSRATGTDANVIQVSREGVACGLIGIPNRYMHSPVEVVHLDDLDRAAQLLTTFCAGLSPDDDWTP